MSTLPLLHLLTTLTMTRSARSKIGWRKVNKRDHAVRVLTTGLSGQARTDAMVKWLSNPDGMLEAYRSRMGLFRTRSIAC